MLPSFLPRLARTRTLIRPLRVPLKRSIYSASVQPSRSRALFLAAGALSAAGLTAYSYKDLFVSCSEETDEVKKCSRIYTLDEVAEHDSMETGIWVTFDGGVYDVTSFIADHPGGSEKILMAAGASVDPFWAIYRQHLTPEVLKILGRYRIGSISAEEQAQVLEDVDDPYIAEPKRDAALKVNKAKPFNAECPGALLTDNYITPSRLWYVRHHHPVPLIEESDYSLTVTKEGGRTISLSLEELKKFPPATVTVTLQCAGNRRSELADVAPVLGLPWQTGAISTATFTGARLVDVLRAIGVEEGEDGEAEGVEHVQFRGMDCPYDGSIPASKALSRRGDVLLAYSMNGEALPREHGYPVRAVVPGTLGARNVKWVTAVVASGEEAHSTWQRGVAYKGLSPSVKELKGVDPSKLTSVQELPVQSAICSPAAGSAVVAGGEVALKGYAWSGGGRGIVRVDLSTDDGETWHTATLTEGASQPQGRAWAWTFWQASIPLPAGAQEGSTVQVCCRAVDDSFNVQPERLAAVWSRRGILNNAWHRLPLTVTAAAPAAATDDAASSGAETAQEGDE